MLSARTTLHCLGTLLPLLLLPACFKPAADSYPLGHEKNPIVMALVPSVEAEQLVESADELLPLLQAESGLHYRSFVAPSYVGIVEAMSIGKVHVAWLPPLAYVFAHERNGDRAALKVVRDGKATYRGQIVVMADSGIETIADLKGKRIAFTEQASTSGYMYPRALLGENGVDVDSDLAEVIFAKSHDSAVVALLNGAADAACCFDDARIKVAEMGFPDVLQTTRILAYTPEIPADNVTLYSGLDEELSRKVVDGLLAVMNDEKGQAILMDLYEVEGLVPATDADYDPVRKMANVLGLDLEQQVRELD